MTYQDILDWMFKQLPMYQNQGKTAFKKDLSNTHLLSEYLQHPEQKFKSIHVAGTNGKGSTSNMLAAVLQDAGYKVGLHTSPHLKDFRERIKINGVDVNKEFVIDFILRNKAFLEQHELSFFELTVGMAFQYFAEQEVDIAIIEVGMGGRLDSTNIITPEISVITNIGFDHMQFLGNTYEAIATEKAGIIKPNIPVVIGETHKKTKPVFTNIAQKNNAKIYFADELVHKSFNSDLKGNYQKHNIKTAVQVLKILNTSSFNISEGNIKNGFENVVKYTNFKGRWQVLQANPKIICDTAHNKEGLSYVIEQLETENYEQLHIVFGVVNDKDVLSLLPLLPKDAIYYFCKPNVPRGLAAKALQSYFISNGFHGNVYNSVKEALDQAKTNAAIDDLIYVGGSTFVVAEII
ncbi:MAG: folylpolyglutamate synthase/dihydrofolate synthase family protein [Psychroserpens sp.]|uniref:bifunctional folylpolyglutamate synthase/dihydrofolate synthase n=1 Tax=Psychroserpens sp. TaxID=2020870 RepID=UPI003C7FDFCD